MRHRSLWLAGSLLIVLLLPRPAGAHDLRHTVEKNSAVTVRLFFPDDSPFPFTDYEIYRAGEETPRQVGKTDREGRIIFVPDSAGEWRIKAFSGDGHGLDIIVSTDEIGDVTKSDRPLIERYGRVITGIGFILGLFGVISLFYRKKRT